MIASVTMMNYATPDHETKKSLHGKVALVTGATGLLGAEVAKEFARRGARLILQYNTHVRKALELELALKMIGTQVSLVQADYSRSEDVRDLVRTVHAQVDRIDFLAHTAGVCRRLSPRGEGTARALLDHVNQIGPIEITLGLEDRHSPGAVILYIGMPGEDSRWDTDGLLLDAKNGLHHFAVRFAATAAKRGIRCIYYLPGVVHDEERQAAFAASKQEAMHRLGQPEPLNPVRVARNIVSSMLNEPIGGVDDACEGPMLIRRDGYGMLE